MTALNSLSTLSFESLLCVKFNVVLTLVNMPETRNAREIFEASEILLQMCDSDRSQPSAQSNRRVPAAGSEGNATRRTSAAVNDTTGGNTRANTRAPIQMTAMPNANQRRARPVTGQQGSHHRVQSAPANRPRAQQSSSGRAIHVQPPSNHGKAAPALNTNQNASQPAAPEQRLVPMNANQSLQAYLIHQQRIAGIAPQDMIAMPDQQQNTKSQPGAQSGGQSNTPSLVQFSREGSVVFPQVAPARFDGVLLPPPSSTARTPQSLRSGATSDPANYATGRVVQSMNENIGAQGYSVSRDGCNVGTFHSQNLATNSRANAHVGQCNESIGQQDYPLSSNQLPRLRNLNTTSANGPRDRTASQSTRVRRHFNPHLDFPSVLTSFPQLLAMVIDWLKVDDFLNLYAASKRFYSYVKANPEATITRFAFKRFGDTAQIFAHSCYQKLTVYSHGPRPENVPGQVLEMRPSPRWLKMLDSREKVVNDIMSLFDQSGYTLTSRCAGVLKKMWFLMDIPDNRRRTFAVQNKYLWSDNEVFYAVFIFAQIESRFTHNVSGTPRSGFRRLLMGQQSLTLLRDALKGTALRTNYEVLREFIRWKYIPTPDEADMFLFGVPAGEHGLLQYEYYGHTANREKLQRPDDLLLREMARRQLDMGSMYAWVYVQSEMDPSLKRDYQLEPEISFLQLILYEAKKNSDEPSNWWKDAVVDNYCEESV